ncbi:PALM protein, partial [Crocuta crocuta]
ALPRLQKEIEVLENAGPLTTATGEGTAAPSPAKDQKTEVALDSRQVRRWCPARGKRASNTPVRTAEGSTMMKAAMYSVEITVEKDKVTGETRVLSSTTLLPREPLPRGIKVYEDETKVVHAVDGTAENGVQPLSSSEVDELLHKADEVTLGEAGA